MNNNSTNPIDTPKHNFKNFKEARNWAKKNIVGSYLNRNTSENIYISKNAIDKYLSQQAVEKSISIDAHLSALTKLPELIKASILIDRYMDRNADPNYKEIQRLYGLIGYEEGKYLVKITVKIFINDGNKAYSYEVMQTESPEGTHGDRIQQSADFLLRSTGLTNSKDMINSFENQIPLCDFDNAVFLLQ